MPSHTSKSKRGGARKRNRPVIAAEVRDDQKAWLTRRAEAEDRSVSAIIRAAIDLYRSTVEVA